MEIFQSWEIHPISHKLTIKPKESAATNHLKTLYSGTELQSSLKAIKQISRRKNKAISLYLQKMVFRITRKMQNRRLINHISY